MTPTELAAVLFLGVIPFAVFLSFRNGFHSGAEHAIMALHQNEYLTRHAVKELDLPDLVAGDDEE